MSGEVSFLLIYFIDFHINFMIFGNENNVYDIETFIIFVGYTKI